MSARYKLLALGVLDTQTAQVVTYKETEKWIAFQAWVAAGNTPDPEDAPAPVPIGERRLRQKIKVWRSEATNQTIPVSAAGTTFKLNMYDVTIMYAIALTALGGGALPAGFGWRDENGVFTALTLAQFKTIINKIGDRGFALRQARWAKEDAIDAAADPEVIDPEVTAP